MKIVDFSEDQLQVTYDPTKYDSTNPQVLIYYTVGETTNNRGIRLPSTSTRTVKFGWDETYNVEEELPEQEEGNTWTLTVENTGKVTVVSPTEVEYSFTFEVLNDVGSLKIGFKEFDASGTNCFQIFNPNKIEVGK